MLDLCLHSPAVFQASWQTIYKSPITIHGKMLFSHYRKVSNNHHMICRHQALKSNFSSSYSFFLNRIVHISFIIISLTTPAPKHRPCPPTGADCGILDANLAFFGKPQDQQKGQHPEERHRCRSTIDTCHCDRVGILLFNIFLLGLTTPSRDILIHRSTPTESFSTKEQSYYTRPNSFSRKLNLYTMLAYRLVFW